MSDDVEKLKYRILQLEAMVRVLSDDTVIDEAHTLTNYVCRECHFLINGKYCKVQCPYDGWIERPADQVEVLHYRLVAATNGSGEIDSKMMTMPGARFVTRRKRVRRNP